jgi:hypothetical protein
MPETHVNPSTLLDGLSQSLVCVDNVSKGVEQMGRSDPSLPTVIMVVFHLRSSLLIFLDLSFYPTFEVRDVILDFCGYLL